MYSSITQSDDNIINKKLVWFSYKQKKYEVVGEDSYKFLHWLEDEEPVMWDWDNCYINIAKQLDEERKIRLVIRTQTRRNSEYLGDKPIQLRYMMGIDVDKDGLSEPPWEEDNYQVTSERKNLQKLKIKPHSRWVFSLDKRYFIWEWARKDKPIESSKSYYLYHTLKERFDSPSSLHRDNIFRTDIKEDTTSKIIPVIYQPAVDSLNNYLRELHCVETKNSDGSHDVEVSLVFNNEELRRFRIFGLLDDIYRRFRLEKYGRIFDIETIKIHLSKENVAHIQSKNKDSEVVQENGSGTSSSNNTNSMLNYADNGDSYFIFQNIYSGKEDLQSDTIHEDKEVIHRPIKYYFNSRNHPIIFINTSNHAMAEHDNNHQLWKWEYVAWVKKSPTVSGPIILGTMSRKELENSFSTNHAG